MATKPNQAVQVAAAVPVAVPVVAVVPVAVQAAISKEANEMIITQPLLRLTEVNMLVPRMKMVTNITENEDRIGSGKEFNKDGSASSQWKRNADGTGEKITYGNNERSMRETW